MCKRGCPAGYGGNRLQYLAGVFRQLTVLLGCRVRWAEWGRVWVRARGQHPGQRAGDGHRQSGHGYWPSEHHDCLIGNPGRCRECLRTPKPCKGFVRTPGRHVDHKCTPWMVLQHYVRWCWHSPAALISDCFCVYVVNNTSDNVIVEWWN